MTTFRLVTYGRGSEVATEIVDGVDRDDLAIRLLIANCTSKRCKLFADDVLIAEMERGTWSTSVPRFDRVVRETVKRNWMEVAA
jgi:hypothetical protein